MRYFHVFFVKYFEKQIKIWRILWVWHCTGVHNTFTKNKSRQLFFIFEFPNWILFLKTVTKNDSQKLIFFFRIVSNMLSNRALDSVCVTEISKIYWIIYHIWREWSDFCTNSELVFDNIIIADLSLNSAAIYWQFCRFSSK